MLYLLLFFRLSMLRPLFIYDSEIFGPILPVVSVKDPREAVQIISSKDRPLALYIFTNDSRFKNFGKLH